jgi:choloylglycine hydrolase
VHYWNEWSRITVLFDGLNEKGPAAGMFYFLTSASYMPYTPVVSEKTIAQ